MGTGDFGNPPPGPKIGQTKQFGELDPEQQAELGDLAALEPETVTPQEQPVAEPQEAVQDAELPPLARGPLTDDEAEEAAINLEAVQEAIEREIEEEDPEVLSAKPTAADKQEFMRSILGNVAYAKEYQLFGGMIVVTLQDLTPLEEDAIYGQLAADQAAGRIETESDWDLMLNRYRALYGIKKLLHTGEEGTAAYARPTLDFDQETGIYETSGVWMEKHFGNATLYRAVMRTVRIFRYHLEAMFERALDSDFWKVDGSDSQSEPTSEAPSTTQESPALATGD
jgi:hypothetical protein